MHCVENQGDLHFDNNAAVAEMDCTTWIAGHRRVIDACWTRSRCELLRLRPNYAWPPGSTALESAAECKRVASLAQADVVDLGRVRRSTFENVLRWGFNNNDSALRASSEQQIEDASREAILALRTDDPAEAARHLGILRRIGIVSTTKVLALAMPARFPIYDSRVGRRLRDLQVDGAPLIPIPPSWSDPGTRSSDALLHRGFAEPTCLLRYLANAAKIEGTSMVDVASVADVEMALLMKGAT